jgi:hypothetical protein
MRKISNEERFFLDWLKELESKGLCSEIKEQPKTYKLGEPLIFAFDKKLKTKTKTIEKTILQPVTYTPDFEFKLSDKLADILYNGESYDSPLFIKLPKQDTFIVDTKGTFKSNDSDISAPIKIKWVWQNYKEFVQLIKPFGGLFKNTFYPKTYFTTDKNQPRSKKVKGKLVPIIELEEFKKIDVWLNEIL